MRLRDYLFLLTECGEQLLKYEQRGKIVGGVQQVALTSFKEPMNMVNKLSVSNLFNKKVQVILKNFDYLITTVNEEVIMDQATYNSFNNKMNLLHESVLEFKQILEQVIPPENKNTLNFKLPNDIENIEQFNKFVEDLKDSLMFCQRLKIKPKFAGLDSGSSWFQFVIDSAPVVLFIFSLLIGFLQTAKLYLETEKLWNERIEKEKAKKVNEEKIQYLEQLKKEELEEHQTEEYKIIRKTLEKIGIENLFGAENKKLEQDIGQINEFVNAVDISMKKMVKLLERGMEIHPAIAASEETKTISKNIKEQVSAYQRVAIGVKDIEAIETNLNESEKDSSEQE